MKLCADLRIFGLNRCKKEQTRIYNVRCRQLPLCKAWGNSVVRTDDPSVAETSQLMQGDLPDGLLDQLDIGHFYEFMEFNKVCRARRPCEF